MVRSAIEEDRKFQRRRRILTFVSGGIAGAVSRTATAPLDRVKILIQEGTVVEQALKQQAEQQAAAAAHAAAHPNLATVTVKQVWRARLNLFRVVQHVYREGGVIGFWRGNGANCVKAGPEFAVVFSVRRFLMDLVQHQKKEYKKAFSEMEVAKGNEVPHHSVLRKNAPWFIVAYYPSVIVNFFVGAAAGATAQSVLYPLELTKTRMAVSKSGEFRGLGDCILQTYKKGGVREFYHGIVPNLLGIIPFRGLEIGIFFTIQQYIHKARERERHRGKRHLEHKDESGVMTLAETTAAGIFASLIAQTVTYPLNLVRTRLQTQGVNGRPIKYKSMTHCFVSIYQAEGWHGLMRGLLPNYLKAIPASVITFIVFDRLEAYFERVCCS